jgi:hypothetical protein
MTKKSVKTKAKMSVLNKAALLDFVMRWIDSCGGDQRRTLEIMLLILRVCIQGGKVNTRKLDAVLERICVNDCAEAQRNGGRLEDVLAELDKPPRT